MNGWTNRETWLVVVHFSDIVANESPLDWDWVKEEIETEWNKITESGFGIFFDDYINFELINWEEIKASAYGEEE
jgi:aspartyl/asparaginyl beta-hydroxylase (cupin superfamily)